MPVGRLKETTQQQTNISHGNGVEQKREKEHQK